MPAPKNKIAKPPARRQSTRNWKKLNSIEQGPTAGKTKMVADAQDTSTAGTSDGSTAEGVYFWRETEPETGYLSQWYPCAFTDETGTVYKTAEHYMMYQKALLFNDEATAAKVLAGDHPRKVKALGRQVKDFDEAEWLRNRERVVRQGTYLKFTRPVSEKGLRRGASRDAPLVGGSLGALLLSTGDLVLVEASPFDRIWGIGFTAANAEASKESWGLNLLGKALMEVRDELRQQDDAAKAENGEEEV